MGLGASGLPASMAHPPLAVIGLAPSRIAERLVGLGQLNEPAPHGLLFHPFQMRVGIGMGLFGAGAKCPPNFLRGGSRGNFQQVVIIAHVQYDDLNGPVAGGISRAAGCEAARILQQYSTASIQQQYATDRSRDSDFSMRLPGTRKLQGRDGFRHDPHHPPITP